MLLVTPFQVRLQNYLDWVILVEAKLLTHPELSFKIWNWLSSDTQNTCYLGNQSKPRNISKTWEPHHFNSLPGKKEISDKSPKWKIQSKKSHKRSRSGEMKIENRGVQNGRNKMPLCKYMGETTRIYKMPLFLYTIL